MEAKVKNIVRNSYNVYKECSKKEQKKMKKHVETMLEQHNNAIENIGVGYADYLVKSAKVFLRIVNN